VVKHRPIWQTSTSTAMQSRQPATTDAPMQPDDTGRPVDGGTRQPLPGSPPVVRPPEIGGRPGPDPTRYGDWEKNGRCIDF